MHSSTISDLAETLLRDVRKPEPAIPAADLARALAAVSTLCDVLSRAVVAAR